VPGACGAYVQAVRSIGMTADDIIRQLDGFKPNTRAWAVRWILDGMPWHCDAPYPLEHHVITANLHQFRKSLLNTSEEVMARVKKAVHEQSEAREPKETPKETPTETTTVVEMQQAGVNAAQLVENYIKLRNKIAELKEAFKTRITPILELQQKIEGVLMAELDKLGAASLRTDRGTAFTQVETSATVDNWEQTLDYIQANQAWDLLERRVAKGAVLATIEETKKPIPGVKVSQIRVLRVRTA